MQRGGAQQGAPPQRGDRLGVIIGVLIVFPFFALRLGWIVRVGMLVILAGFAPLALACYCLP